MPSEMVKDFDQAINKRLFDLTHSTQSEELYAGLAVISATFPILYRIKVLIPHVQMLSLTLHQETQTTPAYSATSITQKHLYQAQKRMTSWPRPPSSARLPKGAERFSAMHLSRHKCVMQSRRCRGASKAGMVQSCS